MRNDDVMDQVLRDALAAPPPRLSPEFDARVMRRVHPRRLPLAGRAVMTAYAVGAGFTMIWFMRAVPVDWIAGSLALAAVVAAASSAYVRRVVPG